MVFDKKKDSKVIKNLSPSSEKCNKKVDLINKGKEGVDNNGDSIRTVLSDQEYIVFSFREDGSFDVATDSIGAKSESYKSVDGKHENSKLVSRKQKFINRKSRREIWAINFHQGHGSFL